MTITFKMRDGTKITGDAHEDFGHALLITVHKANRKNLLGRKMLFAKNDMIRASAHEERV
jgi:hypothetical protein